MIAWEKSNLPTAKGNVQLRARFSKQHSLHPLLTRPTQGSSGNPPGLSNTWAVLRLRVFYGSWAVCTSFGKRRGGSLLFAVGTFQYFGGLTLLCCMLLTSRCTSIFNPSHFLETHRSQRLQETHSWFSSCLTRGLYQNEEVCVSRDNRKLGSGSQSSARGPACAEMGGKKMTR